jgi:hypothetical protein
MSEPGSQLAALRGDPEALYGALAALANGGVSEPALEAAKDLARTEKSLRAAVLYGVLLLRAGQLADAEATLRAAQKQHGDHPALLINLAKLAQKRGDNATALALGRRSLDAAPNDEIALGWWASLMRLAGKDAELLPALEALGGKAGAWRPWLQLAEYHLEKQHAPEAERHFVRALDASGNARPCVELVARDLRATDRHEAMVRVLGPRWQLAAHGPYVALALARAHLSLGQLREADALIAQSRPALASEAAGFLAQLEALRAEKLQAGRAAPSLSSVPITGAVWAEAAPALLPKPPRDRVIAFAQLADCTAKRPAQAGASFEPARELEVACRAIPLALAEAVTLGADAAGQALIATMGDQGLVTLTEHLDLEAALPLASAKAPPRVLVTGFFSRTVTNDLQLDLIAHDLGGGKPLTLSLTKGTPAELLARAERDLMRQLERAGLLATRAPALARPPPSPELLAAVHQALVVTLTRAGRVDAALKWGGAKGPDLALELARTQPGADTPALLALAGLDGEERKDEVAAALAARPKLASVKVPA